LIRTFIICSPNVLLKIDGARREEIMDELDRAIELNSNSVSARSLRGKLLLDSGHL